MTGTIENLNDAVDEHLEILGALERGDGRAARDAMAAHIDARLGCVLGQHPFLAMTP
jgi:DNA-binding GntR family transcriptional regulator